MYVCALCEMEERGAILFESGAKAKRAGWMEMDRN